MVNKKVVLKVELHDDKTKQKAMKTVCGITGVQSISMDMKEDKMTVIAAADPVCIVTKLRRYCRAEVVSIGPEKEPDKKEKSPKDNAKQEELKTPEEVAEFVRRCVESYSHMNTYHCYSIDENPSLCVIL